MEINFAPTTEADRKFFINVHHTAYKDVITQMFGWDEKLQDQFANKAFDEGGMHIVYNDEEKIGVVGWDVFPEYLWLKEIFISPEYQGKGIGTKILQASQLKAQKLGKPLKLQTLKQNLGAKKLYQRFGFRVESETETHTKMILESAAAKGL